MSLSGLKISTEHKQRERERNMKQLLKMSAAPAAALLAMAFVSISTPAAAGEYCRQDVTSGMRSCSFETMAQCQAMSSGRGGDCYRDPFLPNNSNALAYAPKHSHKKSAVAH
jgi:Protein of unknown function (DUF3551)